jgi:HK97 family phage portal protein
MKIPLISWFQRKISMAGWITSFTKAGRPVWTERNYEQLSREGYMKCVTVYSCVRMCAKGAARVPFIIRSKSTKKEIEDRNHPLWKLLHQPNPWQSGATFWEAVYAYRKLNGNSYIEGVVGDGDPAPMGKGRPPDQLFCKRPDLMKVVAGNFGTPLGYVYESMGKQQTWDVDQFDGSGSIIHWKTFHPLNDWYGFSDIEASAYAIDQHNEAGAWNKALLQNAGSPSGALSYEPKNNEGATLTERQYNKIKADIEENMKGSRNAGRPLILDGGMKWIQMSLSPRDMDWIEGKHVSSREICHAHGVPPFLLGIPGDSTYNNYKEARQGLYEDTILADVDSLCDELNMKLAPLFGEDIEVWYDEDEIPALAPKREAKWLAVTNATWLSIDEKREATGYEPIGSEEAEAILIPSTLTPLDGILDAPLDPHVDPITGKPLLPDPNKPDPNADPKDEGMNVKMMRAERRLAEALVRHSSKG